MNDDKKEKALSILLEEIKSIKGTVCRLVSRVHGLKYVENNEKPENVLDRIRITVDRSSAMSEIGEKFDTLLESSSKLQELAEKWTKILGSNLSVYHVSCMILILNQVVFKKKEEEK